MAAAAKDPDLVNEITFLHSAGATKGKDSLSKSKPLFMKFIFIAIAGLTFLSFQCKKEYTGSSCINAKIARIKSKARWNPPAEVNEYIYQGKHVFLFSADCCDQYYELYDESCNLVCAPSGGLTGHGDGRCNDFYTAAQHVRLVWKDSR